MKIMVIDDERSVREMLHIGLSRLGYDCSVYDDPTTAMTELHSDTDLVISDICMPGLSGFHVASLVSERLGNAPPRTLLISAFQWEEPMDEHLRHSIIGVLRKPFRMHELERILKFVEDTRVQCPGARPEINPCRFFGRVMAHTEGALHPICATRFYADCPHYDRVASEVQEWVSAHEFSFVNETPQQV